MSGPVGLAFALRYAYQSTTLGDGIDGDATGGGSGSGISHAKYAGSGGLPGDELGYQLLDTRFTGSSAHNLSGVGGYWEFADQDKGVAQILSAFEITGKIPQGRFSF